MGGTSISRVGRIRVGIGVRGGGGVGGEIERDIEVRHNRRGESSITVIVVADHDSDIQVFRPVFVVLECLSSTE
jgi:hypothetical protein